MIVISADRPQSKIDIGDGQTIRQRKCFENHSLLMLILPKISMKMI
jgi:2-succinyl-5-enolpyruvyl-6-hydroxy-3-cyclohexene-1-carboxylate synthase